MSIRSMLLENSLCSLRATPPETKIPRCPADLVDTVDDRLAVRPDFIDVFVKVQNPAEGLLRRRDVVALGTEHDDGRPNIAQVDGSAIGGLACDRSQDCCR